MNYGQLKDALADWCQRNDLATAIPTWIELATAGFNRALRVPEMESRDATTLTDEYTQLPSDFLEIIGIKDSDNRELRYLARQQFSTVVAQHARLDVPIFTIEDFQLRLWPAPSVSSPLSVTILYYERLAPLVSDLGTNWLLADYPDLYLYGALMHSRVWLVNDERVPLIKAMYDEALAQLSRRKVAATGIASAVGSEVPVGIHTFDIQRGWM